MLSGALSLHRACIPFFLPAVIPGGLGQAVSYELNRGISA